jgi:hypothetical protein
VIASALALLLAQASPSLDAAQIDSVIAAAHAAAGGAQLDAFGAMTQAGTFVQGGGPPSSFDSVTDLRNGYTRSKLVIGPATFLQGYDGSQWAQTNGALSIVSLPSFVADAVTQAYLASNAYFRADARSTITSGRSDSAGGHPTDVLHVEPTGGSPADLYFDAATHRLVKIVAQTAQGPDTTTFANFQTIQGVLVATSSTDVDSAGTTTVTTIASTQFAASPQPGVLARPTYVSQGALAAPVTIPFVSDIAGVPGGHIVVPVSLDAKAASLVFDSGGANFLVPQAAQRLGLHASGGAATGGVGNKEQMTQFAAVSTVDFGGARLFHQSFVVTPLSYAFSRPRKGVSPEGLIGFEYLANFRVAVRYAQHRIDLAPFDAPAAAGGVTLPFKSDGRHAYVLATIDGVSGYYLLDTGNSGGIVLNLPFVQANGLFPNAGLTYQSPGGVGGGFPVQLTAAKSFAFAGQTYSDVPVSIPQVSAGFFATRGVAGNLGGSFLARFTVVFDYKSQTVTFIPNKNIAMPFRSDHIGLSLNQNDAEAFEVTRVVPGSPAATAGIRAGDRITALAGRQISAGLGLGDMFPYSTGAKPFAVTVVRGDSQRTVTLRPRSLLPPPQ